ncbi:MBL fold metallo-hydrolase [Cellvibrio fontiphilus]|uniref:MBL fold metallo-hydrolase n=1 Tax=Cellvibrio fontiphilus TaxID=1815559 RepID=A0ABV7FEC6_9GAMM
MQHFSQQISFSKPAIDCLEISLFGPGTGECLVIHFGGGDWFIVDSCIDPQTKNPVAVDYLEAIGVSLDQVKGILITHWHSDHTAGVARLFKSCKNANLYIPNALKSEQALQLLMLYQKNKFSSVYKPLKEYSEIINFLMENNAKSRLRVVGANYIFFDNKDLGARLIALSPSASAINQSISALTQLMPIPNSDRLPLVLPSGPNLNAVALHLSFDGMSALLGSDLEWSENSEVGWHAVLNDQIYSQLQLSKATIFKVPHHGSDTGHHEKIWKDLLSDKPTSLTTPFFRSSLPRPTDVERITTLSSVFALAKSKSAQKVPKRDKIVEAAIKSSAKQIIPIDSFVGHIQLRALAGEVHIAVNDHPVLFSS